MPVWPAAAWLAASGLARIVAGRDRPAGPWAALVLAAGLVAFVPGVIEYVRNGDLVGLMRGRQQLAGGEWLARHAMRGETIATARLGGLAYRALDHTVWDMQGLTDREASRHVYRNRRLAWRGNPVAERHPDWIAVVHDRRRRFYHDDEDLSRELAVGYRLVDQLPQGPMQTWHFYRRR
jgi:hypothetical protein